MSRWEPDGRRRLQEAALALYAEQGFSQTTAAAVAERAGLTERTFFRYFADKREVLFGNEDALQALLTEAVDGCPADASSLDVIAAGLTALAAELQPRRDDQLRRAHIIAAHPELQERELIKLASWSAAVEDALRQRGMTVPAAKVAAEVGMAVFRVAFRRWTGNGAADLPSLVHEALEDLRAFAGG